MGFKQYKRRGQAWNYTPGQTKPHRVSRSKIDLFVECPRCFYLDQRLGVARPSTPPFTLNNVVDELFKKEFDVHREAGTKHPIMEKHNLDAVPLKHKDMDKWRDALRHGIEHLHEPTGLSVRGGIDDVWVNSDGEFIVVDYKATGGKDEITLDEEWKIVYKRQMEIYQWLFRQEGFTVDTTGYFVYANAPTTPDAFDATLNFEITLLPYTGSTEWIEPTLLKLKETLDMNEVPPVGEGCEYCAYREMAGKDLLALHKNGKK